MATCKVTYQGILRRFTISTNITWFDLESRLRTIFSIPSSLPIFLLYTDEDGDVITLSSDAELQDVLAHPDNTTTFKFTLTTTSSETASSILDVTENIRSGVSNLQLEEQTTTAPQQMQIEQQHISQQQPQSRPPSYYHTTVTDDDEFDAVLFEKEFQGETSTTAASQQQQQEQQQQEETQPPFDFTEQLQLLLTQFQDVLDQNPQILETARNVIENIHRSIPADIEIWAQWLSSFRSDRPENQRPWNQGSCHSGQCGPQDRPKNERPWNQGCHSRQCGPQDGTSRGCHKGGAGFTGRSYGPFGAVGSGRPRFGPGCHRGSGFGGCRRNNGPFGGLHHGLFGGLHPYGHYWEQRQQQQGTQEKITPEQIQEKIKLLHEMGYWEDDAENEDLLTRYNGNLERVIEVLVQRQDERGRLRQQQQPQQQETLTDQHMEDSTKESPNPYNLQ